MAEYTCHLYLNATLPATREQARAVGVEVRWNHNPLLDGYRRATTAQDGDPLTPSMLVFATEADNALVAAEEAFAYYNADDRPNGQHERSASVGDVFRVERMVGARDLTWWAVEAVGFRPVPTPLITQYAPAAPVLA